MQRLGTGRGRRQAITLPGHIQQLSWALGQPRQDPGRSGMEKGADSPPFPAHIAQPGFPQSHLLLVQQYSASSSALRLLCPPSSPCPCSPVLQPCAALAGVRTPLLVARTPPSLQQQGPNASTSTALLLASEQPVPSTQTTVPGSCWCCSLTMGAPRWPTRAGLGGSWFSSMMQGEVIPRGSRYSIIITTQYTSSRNTLRPAGRSREDRGVRYRGSILQAVRNKPRLLHLALTCSCPSSDIAPQPQAHCKFIVGPLHVLVP